MSRSGASAGGHGGSGGGRPAVDERGLPVGYAFKPEYEVTPRDVRERLTREPGSVLLVDVRTQPELDVARVAEAVHIPLDELERRWDELEPQPGQLVAVLCHHGVRSMKGALLLRAVGVAGAMSVAGGIEAWSLGADPSVARYERAGGVCRVIR